jgi:hypothetical protein
MACSTDTDNTYFLYTSICYIHNLRGSTRRQERLHNEELLTKYSTDQIMEDEMGRKSGIAGGVLKESVCLEDLDIEIRIIFKSILNRMGRCGLDLFSSG